VRDGSSPGPRSPASPATSQPPCALAARDLGKRYQLSRSRLRPLLRRAWRGAAAAEEEGGLWAVRGVSFDVAHGASLGIIGRNGSGKSTLLRLLSGTARPSAGQVAVGARLACLLELGTGFQALETGRENAEGWLVLLGGMTRREARAAARDVERFADVGPYFDRPLRTCSAGMQLRVAFATAAMLSPELLIADEVLAVGDEGFQRRCNRFFDRFLDGGGSLVLCSHDLSQIQRLCERTLWLDAGTVRDLGESRSVVRHYREAMGTSPEGAEDDGARDAGAHHAIGESTGLAFEVVDLHVLDPDGAEVRDLALGASIVVVVDILAPAAVPHVHIGLTREDLTPVYGLSSDMEDVVPVHLGGARYRYRLALPDLPLTPGRYRVRAHALDETATRLYDTVELLVTVRGGAGAERASDRGLVRIPASWHREL
jgi:lipopolysaccharide transport system ATP-binding protein